MEQKRKGRMIKIFVILGVVLLLGVSANTCFSQEVEKKELTQVISVNPLALVYGTANISYEKALKPNLGVEGEVVFASQKMADWEWTAFGVTITAKKYTESSAPLKFWYGGGIGILPISAKYTYFDWTEWKTKTETASGTFLSLSGSAGYRWLIGEKFTIEGSLGISYYAGSLTIAGEKLPFGGITPTIGLSLGYAF